MGDGQRSTQHLVDKHLGFMVVNVGAADIMPLGMEGETMDDDGETKQTAGASDDCKPDMEANRTDMHASQVQTETTDGGPEDDMPSSRAWFSRGSIPVSPPQPVIQGHATETVSAREMAGPGHEGPAAYARRLRWPAEQRRCPASTARNESECKKRTSRGTGEPTYLMPLSG